MEEPYLLVSCQVLALDLHWGGTRGLLSTPLSVLDLESAGWSCYGGPHVGLDWAKVGCGLITEQPWS